MKAFKDERRRVREDAKTGNNKESLAIRASVRFERVAIVSHGNPYYICVTGLIISQNTRKAAMRAAKASVKHKKVNGESVKIFLSFFISFPKYQLREK